jgi:hypothetical protein
MKDLYNEIDIQRAISPVDVTGDTPAVSQIIDCANYEGVLFTIATGTLADAGATFTTLIEDGDAANLSDHAAVADAYLLGTEAAASFTQADDDKVFKIAYVGPKRYVRLTITPAGNAGSAPISATAARYGGRFLGPQPGIVKTMGN